MIGYWRLNGVALLETDVKVTPVGLKTSRKTRQGLDDLHKSTQRRERMGLDLPQLNIEILLRGRGDDKYQVLAIIQAALDNDDVWTLQAPTDLSVFVYQNAKRAPLSTLDWNFDAQKSLGIIKLSISAVVNGIWVADGGTYCQPMNGTFSYNGTTYTRQSDGVNTGTLPLLQLPNQHTGYPLAVQYGTFQRVVPLVASTGVDANGRTVKNYDMTGFLHPPPTTSGDVAGYELCASPALEFIDTGIGFILTGPVQSPFDGQIVVADHAAMFYGDGTMSQGMTFDNSPVPTEANVKTN